MRPPAMTDTTKRSPDAEVSAEPPTNLGRKQSKYETVVMVCIVVGIMLIQAVFAPNSGST